VLKDEEGCTGVGECRDAEVVGELAGESLTQPPPLIREATEEEDAGTLEAAGILQVCTCCCVWLA
jgi:hypothetical protein